MPNERTKVILLGLRRSGKTSIQQVLFNNLTPKKSFFLETTTRIIKHSFDTVIPLEIWDCPGNITLEGIGVPLSRFASMIFVIDIRDLYLHPISKLIEFVIAAYLENPNINIEIFVHKAEKLAEDDKLENFRQIHERVTDHLLDEATTKDGIDQIPLNFHLTSIYDHSIQEAFSRVLHKLILSLPYLEELLNVFCANSQSPKAFLFDTQSKLFVATDASPVDSATHNLCCDYLQMLNFFAPLYKSMPPQTTTPPPSLPPSSSSPFITPTSSPHSSPLPHPLTYPSASTTLSPSTGGTTLTYHLITPHLALLAILPTSVYEGKRGLVEHNVVFLREGVRQIWGVEWEGRDRASGGEGGIVV